jgi:hypothetical protein
LNEQAARRETWRRFFGHENVAVTVSRQLHRLSRPSIVTLPAPSLQFPDRCPRGAKRAGEPPMLPHRQEGVFRCKPSHQINAWNLEKASHGN